jgi:hypothetical protein
LLQNHLLYLCAIVVSTKLRDKFVLIYYIHKLINKYLHWGVSNSRRQPLMSKLTYTDTHSVSVNDTQLIHLSGAIRSLEGAHPAWTVAEVHLHPLVASGEQRDNVATETGEVIAQVS